MNRWLVAFILIVTAGALASRLPRLDLRPMHCDEAVHAVKFGELLDTGSYKYDPHEYHGPTLYYATVPFAWLAGQRHAADLTEPLLRSVPVIFSAAAILLLLLVADGLGNVATAAAAVFLAISPIMFFYSRYVIHETFLLSFTLLALACGWRYARTKSAVWLVLAGVAIGVMHASKETFVFNGLACVGALGLMWVWSRFVDRGTRTQFQPLLRPWPLTGAVLASATVSVVLFSSFFTNPSGPMDSMRTYLPWASRAGGESVHVHPWTFYFERLLFFRGGKHIIWTEALIFVLGLIGCVAALTGRKLQSNPANSKEAQVPSPWRTTPAGASLPFLRFVALYTLLLGAMYCAISYKTPWCALGPWQGMILLAGVGVAVIWNCCHTALWKTLFTMALATGIAHLSWQTWRQNFDEELCCSPRNPWVYAHTVADIQNLADKLHDIARNYPVDERMVVQVAASRSDYWPLPWLLRRLQYVGWWDKVPEQTDSAVLVLSPTFAKEIEPLLIKTHDMAGTFGLRPNVFLTLYVPKNIWASYLGSKATDKHR